MPLIALDARMACHTGIGQYLQQLLRAFGIASSPYHFRLLGDPAQLTPLSRGLDAELIPCRAPIYGLREQWEIPRRVGRAALLHTPHFNIPILTRLPQVVTIHDLIYLLIPHAAQRPGVRAYAWARLRAATRWATRIIAISQRTKEDLIDILHVPPTRITVIHQGVGPEFSARQDPTTTHALRRRLGVADAPFLLWVSSLKPHKNPTTAITAFALARQRYHLPHHLIMIGPEDLHDQTPRRLIRRLGVESTVHLAGTVEVAELPALYHAASLLLHPSYYEGFGLPPVEAMASGTPVICSNRGALPEVVGDGALLLPPEEIDAWVSGIYDTLTKTDATAHRVARGRQRAATFTWSRTAEQTLAIYHEVIQDTCRPRS